MTAINAFERKAIISLASMMFLRLFGVFLILPIFALYANKLSNSTPELVGLALGIFGLTQGFLQLPFGIASDHFGRKPLLALGLVLSGLGSLLCAGAQSIFGLIVGRALQGTGAIGSVILALTADLTRYEVRLRSLAFIGIAIGASLILSLLFGPMLYAKMGGRGLFIIAAACSLLAIIILVGFVPKSSHHQSAIVLKEIPRVLLNPQLMGLNLGVAIIHLSLAVIFLKIPFALKDLGFQGQEWRFYTPVFLSALLFTLPCLMMVERKKTLSWIPVIMIGVLACSDIAILMSIRHGFALGVSMMVFFIAFNVLEAWMPSWVSELVKPEYKGTALGIYSSSQFLGIFLGGSLGGWLDARTGNIGVFSLSAALTLLWLGIVIFQMKGGQYGKRIK